MRGTRSWEERTGFCWTSGWHIANVACGTIRIDLSEDQFLGSPLVGRAEYPLERVHPTLLTGEQLWPTAAMGNRSPRRLDQ